VNRDDRWRFLTFRTRADLQAGRRDWFRIDNATDGVAKVYIYDEIGYFGVTAQDFVAELNRITSPEIELHLNTPGGEVFDGIAIYNALLDHDANVTAIVDGAAHSAGSFILQAGDRRVMNRNSEVLIHDGQALGIGDAAMFTELVARLDEASDNIASIYAERSGVSDVKKWRKAMKATTRYGAQQAVDAGLADEVAGTEATTNTWDLRIYGQITEAPDVPRPATTDRGGDTIPAVDPDAEFARLLMKGKP
jgi:ATP-dependent protease ClpP protease subunit